MDVEIELAKDACDAAQRDGIGMVALEEPLRRHCGDPIELAARGGEGGDPGWIRTSDPRFRRPLLYPLSYGTMQLFYTGFLADM